VGRVYNLHCAGTEDYSHCYKLLNGSMAHNLFKGTN